MKLDTTATEKRDFESVMMIREDMEKTERPLIASTVSRITAYRR
jgi:hypothetical protein